LPPGFELEQQPTSAELPPGFELEAPPAQDKNAPAMGASHAFTPAPDDELQARAGAAGSQIQGLGDILLTGLANVPHAAAHASLDILRRIFNPSAVGSPDPGAIDAIPHPQLGGAGRAVAGDIGNALNPPSNGTDADSVIQAARNKTLGTPSAGVQDVVNQTGGVGQDVLNLLPALGAAKGAAGLIRGATAGAPAATIPIADVDAALEHVGYRNLPRQNPNASALERGGASLAGEPTVAAQQSLTNQAVTDRLGAHEAGVTPGTQLTYDALKDARTNNPTMGPVYSAAHAALPEQLTQDAQLQGAIKGIGDTTSQLPRSPDVDALKQTMLDQPNMSRDELFANVQQARDRASRFFASDKPDDQAMAEAYQSLGNAYEDFIGRQLAASPHSPVTLDQWQAARTAFAKNYAVQAALKGNSVDASKIASLQRTNPEQLTGGLRLIAEQANKYPLSTKFGPTTFAPEGIGASGSIEGAVARHVTGPMIGGTVGATLGGPAGAAIGVGAGTLGSAAFQAALRRWLGGSPTSGVSQASRALEGPGLDEFFGRKAPTEPDTGGLTLGGSGAGGPAPQGPGGEIGLADLLSHGVEQPPAAGLSLGDHGEVSPEGIAFQIAPEAFGARAVHGGGDMGTPPSRFLNDEEIPTGKPGSRIVPPEHPGEPTLADMLEDLRDHPDVMSQGVPEGIMTRTANNASGESDASLEAINRQRIEQAQGNDRFLVDPDGKLWPIRGVEAADARPPKGSMIIQKGVGGEPFTILDRGGLPQSHARGLMNRAMAGYGGGTTLGDLLGGG
jgi:hypothetical protein